jgi:hypothetical protein
MPKDLFIKIIQERLIVVLVLSILVYASMWWIYFKLAFKILQEQPSWKLVVLYDVIMIIYTFAGKWLLPNPVYAIGAYILFFLILILGGRAKILATAWTSFLVTLSGGAGDLLLYSPMAIIGGLSQIVLHSVYWNIIGTGTEIVFPLLLLFIVPKLQFSLIPQIKNCWAFFGFGTLWLTICYITIDVLSTLKNSEQITPKVFIPIITLIAAIIFYMKDHRQAKKERETLEEKLQSLTNGRSQIVNLQDEIVHNRIDPVDAIQRLQVLSDNLLVNHASAIQEITQIKQTLGIKTRNLKIVK